MSKVAAIQMTSTADVKQNLQTAKRLLQEAKKAGTVLAVLPEMFPLQSPEAIEKLQIAETLDQGEIQDFLSTQSRELNLWIVSGTIPLKSPHTSKVYAACLVFNDQGEQVAQYNKIHLFDVKLSEEECYRESDTTEAGNQLCVVETPIGKLGLAVCYDLRFPELFRCLLNQGAEIFAIPSAFTEKTGQAHFEILMRARAIENFAYVIGSCQTGEHESGRRTHGHSMIISPWGNVLQLRPHGEGVIIAEIDLTDLRKIRQEFPIEAHQKMKLKNWRVE